jgi:alginate O-acetyltransferase complex protein AlgJ
MAAVAMFLAMLALPDLDLVLGIDPNPSPLREVVKFPNMHSARPLRKLPGKILWYLKSSMGLRGTLVRARGLFAYRWLGTSPLPHSVIAAAPWLFLRSELVLDDYRRVDTFSATDLERWVSVLEARRTWLERHNSRYLLLLIPNKESVYADSMPPWITRRNGPSRLEQLVRRLQTGSKVPILDLTTTLVAAKKAHRVYHYTDTHWNDVGAFTAYRSLLASLAPFFPSLKALAWSDLTRKLETTPGGDLARMCGLKLDLREPQLELSLPSRIDAARFEDGAPITFERMDVGGKRRFVTRGPAGQIASAVLLRDSFGEALIPYFSQHIEKATWVWTYDFPADLILQERPALVIQELVERKLMVIPPTNPPELTQP